MKIKALTTSSKVVIGEVMKYETYTCEVEERLIAAEEAEREESLYDEIKASAETELNKIKEFLVLHHSGNTDFIDAHKQILNDRMMDKEIRRLITNSLYPVDRAMATVYDKYIDMFSANNNPLIVQRTADLRDVRTRLLRNYHKVPEKNLSMLDKECIIVADELFPTDTLCLDKTGTIT